MTGDRVERSRGELRRAPPDPSGEASPLRVVASRIAWECPWFFVRADDVARDDRAAPARSWTQNVVVRREGVWVLPVLRSGEVVLIRSWRHAVGKWSVEIPAGTREERHTVLDTARHELREEVGGTADRIEPLLEAFLAPGLTSQEARVFLATGVVLGPPAREESELIETMVLPAAQAMDMARCGAVTDSVSRLALLVWGGPAAS